MHVYMYAHNWWANLFPLLSIAYDFKHNHVRVCTLMRKTCSGDFVQSGTQKVIYVVE